MSAATLIREAANAGVWIGLDGDKLALEAEVKPPDELIARLKASKPEIVELLRRQAEVLNALKQSDAVDNAAAQTPSPAPWPEPKITKDPPFGADHVPSRYEAKWRDLLAGCPPWATEWQWTTAIFSCRDLFGEWGAELLRLNWQSKDIFDRWHGLGWYLKGKKVTALGLRHAFLEDGRMFERLCR